MKIFRHQEVQVGDIWHFREGLSVFDVLVMDRHTYRESGTQWLSFNLFVLEVICGEESWRGKELVVREPAHAGHGIGLWSLWDKITTPDVHSEVETV